MLDGTVLDGTVFDGTALPGPVLGAHLVLAHQGGWDELTYVLAPVAVFSFLLWRANKRAAQREQNDDAPLAGVDEPSLVVDPLDPDAQ